MSNNTSISTATATKLANFRRIAAGADNATHIEADRSVPANNNEEATHMITVKTANQLLGWANQNKYADRKERAIRMLFTMNQMAKLPTEERSDLRGKLSQDRAWMKQHSVDITDAALKEMFQRINNTIRTPKPEQPAEKPAPKQFIDTRGTDSKGLQHSSVCVLVHMILKVAIAEQHPELIDLLYTQKQFDAWRGRITDMVKEIAAQNSGKKPGIKKLIAAARQCEHGDNCSHRRYSDTELHNMVAAVSKTISIR